jgi:hypothetical protein
MILIEGKIHLKKKIDIKKAIIINRKGRLNRILKFSRVNMGKIYVNNLNQIKSKYYNFIKQIYIF